MASSELRKTILTELFLVPSVVLPTVGGVSCWLLSWVSNGVSVLDLAGLVGVIAGIGWLATRAIFQLDAITERALAKEAEKITRQEEAKLDELQQRLRIDRDYRTKDYLTLLRATKSEFEELTKQPEITLRSLDILKQVRQLFWAAIAQLENSLKLYELAQRIAGDSRTDILRQREEVLNDVQESVEHLKSAVEQFRALAIQESPANIDVLMDELDTSLEVAKKTEERMRQLEGKPEYESYLK